MPRFYKYDNGEEYATITLRVRVTRREYGYHQAAAERAGMTVENYLHARMEEGLMEADIRELDVDAAVDPDETQTPPGDMARNRE